VEGYIQGTPGWVVFQRVTRVRQSSDEYRRSVQGGCSKLMDKSSGRGVAAIGREQLLSGS
jgi:hypothetical protein